MRRPWSRRRAIGRSLLSPLAPALALALAGCGLPGEERTRTVDAPVPYELLDSAPAAGDGVRDGAPLRSVPVVLWLRGDDVLVPAPVAASCEDPPSEVVEATLGTLAAAPSTEERDAGLSSALPPSARLRLVAISNGLARVDVDLIDLGDPERLPFAVGQLVLSVTSAPEVDAIEMVTSGRPVEAPLPGGALADGPVTADDYADLLPGHEESPGAPPGLGCPDRSR
ncbi:hypothetical protein GCM10009641_77550 [Mycobacterium cookii]|uniref:GerMN domain-containing protein n=1 Tax=Nocardioides furvisabuli TaxID=375542 RepID=A0ABP5J0P0_9ACTN|nr:GerMN domain-containing protein [Nocardioides furvisabuli]